MKILLTLFVLLLFFVNITLANERIYFSNIVLNCTAESYVELNNIYDKLIIKDVYNSEKENSFTIEVSENDKTIKVLYDGTKKLSVGYGFGLVPKSQYSIEKILNLDGDIWDDVSEDDYKLSNKSIIDASNNEYENLNERSILKLNISNSRMSILNKFSDNLWIADARCEQID